MPGARSTSSGPGSRLQRIPFPPTPRLALHTFAAADWIGRRGATSRYAVSADLYPAPISGTYAALGLTTSGATQANLPAGGQISVQLSQVAPFDGFHGQYQVTAGQQVLASGAVLLGGFNPVTITVDPAAQTVMVAVNGIDIGTWRARMTPSFIAFEGQGWADDLVVRTLP